MNFEPRITETADGMATIVSDPARGIGITYQKAPRKYWLVLLMFIRSDHRGLAEPVRQKIGLS
jgi:hypothetical protein